MKVYKCKDCGRMATEGVARKYWYIVNTIPSVRETVTEGKLKEKPYPVCGTCGVQKYNFPAKQ